MSKTLRKQKPIHQMARDKGLTPHDQRELQLFRDFLRLKNGNRQTVYEQIYGKEIKRHE